MSKPKWPKGIYQRRNRKGEYLPTYWCWVRFPGEKNPHHESTGTTDLDAAVRHRHALLAESGIIRARRRALGDMTVRDLLAGLVADYERKGQEVPPGMVEALNHALGAKRAIEDVDSDMLDDLCDLWQRHGIRWQRALTAEESTERAAYRVRPLTKQTCHRAMALLRRAYSLAKKKHKLVHPTLCFPIEKEEPNPRPVPPDVLAGIFAALENATGAEAARRDVLRFLYLGGQRMGQVLATQAHQYTAATDTVAWAAADTKQGKPHHVAYMGEAAAILRRFAEHRNPANAALFQNPDGSPITKAQLTGTWKRACRTAGIPVGRRDGYTIHHLRHSFVSEAHEAGLTAGVIQAHTGHVNEPTMLHYLRVSGDAQRRAQEQLEAYRRKVAEQVKSERGRVVALAGRRAKG